MPKAKRKLALVEQLMAEASAILSKAQAFATMEMGQTAQPLWTSAASLQERIAPLLDANGESREAAVYRMSAASCYEKAGDLIRAANLFLRFRRQPNAEAVARRCARGLSGRILSPR